MENVYQVALRVDTLSNWQSVNPALLPGEFAILTLNATYNITCSGFTLDVSSVTMNGNKSLNIKATPTT